MTDKTSLDAFCESLQSLRPASDQIDERQVFFAVGVEAARQSDKRPAGVPIRPMLAAVFVAAIVTAPLAFRAGQMVHTPLGDRVADQTNATVTPAASHPSVPIEVAVENRPSLAVTEKPSQSPLDTTKQPVTYAFSRWLAWDAMVTATQIERESSRTLMAGHASFVTRAHADDLNAYPFSLGSQTAVRQSDDGRLTDDELAVRPLTLGNRTLTVLSPESSR